MSYPRMMRIRQLFDARALEDVAGEVRKEVARMSLKTRLRQGDFVAVTAGSRGIANIALIIRTLIEELKALGANPFVVPAMGSHGDAAAEGQRAIIENYGITEVYVQAPIKAGMDVVQVGLTPEGIPVYFDKYAHQADHVVVVGRVKPHTELLGDIQSGLHKMMLIGLGKYQGAQRYHKAFVRYSFERIIRSAGRIILDNCGILMGLAIVENQYDRTAVIRAVAPEEFYEREKELLVLAKEMMPRLPFQYIDLLIIDWIGKNISGSGLDTNVIGRKHHYKHAAPDEFPKVTRVYVRDLTDESHGNAVGVGIAEFAHARLIKKLNYKRTYMNAITGNEPRAGAIPIHFDTDRQVLDAALTTVGHDTPEAAGVVRIRNTLDVKEVLVSESYLPEVHERKDLEIVEPVREMEFDEEGNFFPF